jgi:hypothetical protein
VSAPKLPDTAHRLRYRLRGQSYWVARYHDRPDVHEWECDWSLVPRQGLVELRLHCPIAGPNNVGVVSNSVDASDRLFQFKIAEARVGVGAGGSGRGTLAQVIGLVHGLDGEATCWAWEYTTRRLVRFEDNVAPGRWRYGLVGAFCWDVLGAKPA